MREFLFSIWNHCESRQAETGLRQWHRNELAVFKLLKNEKLCMERIVKDFFKFELGLIGIIMTILMLCFCSCTTTEYVTVERVRTDTTYITKHQRDSIWLHDSVFVKEWTAGDTVYRDRIQWHTKYIEKQVRDTIYQHRVDSVPQPYPYTIYIEKKLSTLQVVLMTIGCLALIALLVFIVAKIKRFLPCL